jgi:hypothetical protein
MKRGALDLSEVEFSILDEADQMLSVGFEEDVELLYGQMPDGRTNYLFSATMPVWVKKLARNYLTDPVTVDLIGDSKVPSPPIFTLSIRPKPNRATPWHSPFPFPAHSIHSHLHTFRVVWRRTYASPADRTHHNYESPATS